jgi:hypothetical protein
MKAKKELVPKVGDWVQVYMWQAANPFEYLAWSGEKVQVVKRLKKVADGVTTLSAIVSHPEWLPAEGVEVPMRFLCLQTPALVVSEPELTAVPQPGDRVVVAAGPYQRWYSNTLTNLSYVQTGTFKNYSRSNRDWIERYAPDRFPWVEVFTFKQLQGDLALIMASGERYKVPVDCLQVLVSKESVVLEDLAA